MPRGRDATRRWRQGWPSRSQRRAEPGPPAPPSAGGGTAGPRLGRTWSWSPRSQPPDRENEPLLSAAPRPLCGPLLRQPRESHRGLVSPGVKSRPRGAHAASRLPPRSLRLAASQGRGLGEKRGGIRGGQPPRPGGGPGAVRRRRGMSTGTRTPTRAPSAAPHRPRPRPPAPFPPAAGSAPPVNPCPSTLRLRLPPADSDRPLTGFRVCPGQGFLSGALQRGRGPAVWCQLMRWPRL